MKNNFKEKIYKIVKQIPKGSVLSYKEVAKKSGSPKAYRAVGNILNKNYNKKIPCHRVVKSDGKPGGYNRGLKNKVALLKREGVIIRRRKVVR
jgi:O-6-methylguanine DNA methyltransferase